MLNAQNLTQSQAIDFAEKLYQVEILSEKGRDSLIHKIQKREFENGGIVFPLMGTTVPSYDTDLKKSVILNFCAKAFSGEFFYRTGWGKEADAIQKEVYKNINTEKISDEEREKLSFEYQKRIALLKGPSIEATIPIEDSLSHDFGYTVYPPINFPTWSDRVGYIHKNRSVVGKTRTRTLNDLLKIGLIDQRIYDEALPKIQSNELYLEQYLLEDLVNRTVYYEDFVGNKNEELGLLDKLKKVNILSEKGYTSLLSSYKPYEIKRKFDYLPYCNNALVCDLKKYPIESKNCYPLIFDEIKKILPEFDYKNFNIDTKIGEYGKDMLRQDFKIEFSVDNKTYTSSFLDKFIKKEPQSWDKPDSLARISEEFYNGINKFLKDKNSSNQLYFVRRIDGAIGYTYRAENTFGLILMTKQQRDAWGEYLEEFSTENHDNTFNTEGVQKLIKEYDQIGLFKHLTATEIDSAKRRVEEVNIESFAGLLSCFPKNLVYFDWESGNLENPYEELTNNFAAASRGAFTPTNILDNFEKDWKNDTTHYGFTFNGKQYETELEMKNDWLDPKFMELIDKALLEQHIDGKIYPCLNNGQEGGYVFLSSFQFKYLQKHHPTFFKE